MDLIQKNDCSMHYKFTDMFCEDYKDLSRIKQFVISPIYMR
jgi:hypothetical protein